MILSSLFFIQYFTLFISFSGTGFIGLLEMFLGISFLAMGLLILNPK